VRRILKPGGVLRLAVPDLDKAIRAYMKDDARYFHVPDEHARGIGAKLITQIIWYGSVRYAHDL
jgi:predicted SAM-dependent methyltransferase